MRKMKGFSKLYVCNGKKNRIGGEDGYGYVFERG